MERRNLNIIQRDPQDLKATSPESEDDWNDEASEILHDHSYGKKPPRAKEQLQAAQVELSRLEANSRGLNSEQFFLQRFQYDPELIMFYTGFKDYSTLRAFYLALRPTPETIWKWSHTVKLNRTEHSVDAGFKAQHLCLFDQLFLFLCFVRRGFLPFDISTQFQLSEVIVQTTCVTWCHYLFFMLGTLPIWPSRQTVDELMPQFFRMTFPKTRVVLDFIEVPIQMATCRMNASHHRESPTVKSLVGITPSGSVSFVSSVYAASISDRDIVLKSGVLNLLEPGDEVMADKSFEVEDVLDVIGVRFVIPTSSRPNRQFNQDNTAHARHISHLKIHIEKVLSRVTEYHIFDSVPAALCGSVNQLLTVCALLTNFQGSLLK
ncbi:uncharacterized protein LOC121608256 [Chelmon rostratus]|uniref:uncharacterized protein LOC121608256 n=1 Tax=Chelmon rostratus TaxID=109905 RepID=UPI001BEBE69A|nr:uncharacterized protein LOC121608256 [Chelmon rostratus]XP_041795399.1 uncharacterized protein LOC121608256 [Chelmon rostratus]